MQNQRGLLSRATGQVLLPHVRGGPIQCPNMIRVDTLVGLNVLVCIMGLGVMMLKY